MEEQSQRPDDAWSVEDIDSSEDLDAVRETVDVDGKEPESFESIVHCFLRWLEIYGVSAFMEKIESDTMRVEEEEEVIELTRSDAGAWEQLSDLRKVMEKDHDVSMKKQ